MGDRLVRKELVVGIIVLFICYSFMPIVGSLSREKQANQESLPYVHSTGDDSGISLITVKVDGETGLNDWYIEDVRVNFTKSNDIAEIKYQVDGGWMVNYTEPFYITTDSTKHQLKWRALDYEGNYSEFEGPFYFKQDQTPPVIDLIYEWSGDHPPYLFTFTATATDATSGMEWVEFYLNDKLYYTVYGPGPYYVWEFLYVPLPKAIFKAVAYDMAGNSASDYPIFPNSCYIEVLESSIFSTDIVEEQSSQSIIQKTEIVGIEKELYGEKPRSDSSMAGVFDVASLVVAVNRKMLNGNWIDDDFKITMMPDPYDMKDVYYKLDDVNWMRYTEPLFISAEDGFHTFWWFFVDYKGYISPQESVVFNIDRTPPMINFTREKIEENKIKFTANVSDETSGVDIVDFYVDGDFEANFSSPPYEWIYTGSGRHTVTAVVYDKAGNSNSSSLSTWRSKSGQQTVSIPNSQNVMSVIPIVERANYVDDTTPPVTTITFDPPEPDGLCGWYVSNVTIIMNATDDISGVNKIYYSINSEPWQVYDEPILLHQNGVFNIVYFSIDNAGNIEFPKLSYLKIDQTPPEIEFTYVWSGKKPPYTFTYIINAIDTTSGIIRVDLYLNAELQYTFFEPGPYIYIIWEIQWVPVPKSIFRAIAYNFAGLSTYDDIIDPKLSKNRIINAPFLSFLQNFIQSHPNLFPILQKLLQSLLLQ